MHRAPALLRTAVLAAAGLVGACGGGSGGGDAEAPPAAPPSSGSYAWLLKAEGATDALRYGLSLVHPDTPTVEWLVQPASEAVTDARTVASGTVDAAAQRTSAIEARTLVYIVGGDVRRVPLVADGTTPADSVRKAGTSSACRFLLDAVDHATPEASRFIVSTAGTDGSCGTLDDGRAEVRLDAALGLVVTALATEAPLAVLRSPDTLAPRGWIGATQAMLWSTTPPTTVTVRDASRPLTAVLASTASAALVESASGLSLLSYEDGTGFTETAVTGLTGTGWQLAGFDADNFYVWRNSDATTSASWTLQRIGRGTPTAVELASGTGQLASVGLGTTQIYATVLGASQNRLLRVATLVPGSVTTLDTSVTSTVSTVLTSGSGVHQIWRVSGIGSDRIARSVRFVDETGISVYESQNGGFPVAVMEAGSIDWKRSENRRRFVFADGYGDQAFAGSTLLAFDAATRETTALGELPTSEALGGGFVFANAAGGPGTLGGGFAARSSDGVVGAPSRAFVFDAARAASLKLTTQTQ